MADKSSTNTDEFDWNIKSKYVMLISRELEEEGFEVEDFTRIINATVESPDDEDEVRTFIQTHGLNYGDVVNLSDYRFTECYIVTGDHTGDNIGWIPNPDDSASGYLTIPTSILCRVTDFTAKYSEFIHNAELSSVNYHVSPKDKYISTLFDDHSIFDESWEFDVGFDGLVETPEFITLKPKDKSWAEALELSLLPKKDGLYQVQDVLNYFAATMTSWKIKVSLSGAKLEEYKAKYGRGSRTYEFLSSAPQLPNYWNIRKGQSLVSSDKCEWDWILEGPDNTLEEAKSAVKSYLEGFNYSVLTT